MAHGGARPGSGRKPGVPKPSRCFRLDDTEYEQVKEFIKKLRSESKMTHKTFGTKNNMVDYEICEYCGLAIEGTATTANEENDFGGVTVKFCEC